jgi:hypothetical protein
MPEVLSNEKSLLPESQITGSVLHFVIRHIADNPGASYQTNLALIIDDRIAILYELPDDAICSVVGLDLLLHLGELHFKFCSFLG